MPGPGGGGHGGGFRGGGGGFRGGGGGFGGGFHGGGFHGGPPRGPRRPWFGGFYPRWGYFGGGGCCSGVIGALMAPILLVILAVVLLVGTLTSGFSTLFSGGVTKYDEEQFQDYADEQYASAFGAYSSTYEDNLMLVFLTADDYQDYYCIAWVGDNIRTDINNLFGNEYTVFGRVVNQTVASNYKYSLDSNIAQVMETMSDAVTELGGDSSFKSAPSGSQAPSKLINYTELPMTDATVNHALEEFTAETDIPVVIVVDSIASVFQKTLTPESILALIVSVVLIVIAIALLVRYFRNRERKNEE